MKGGILPGDIKPCIIERLTVKAKKLSHWYSYFNDIFLIRNLLIDKNKLFSLKHILNISLFFNY